MDELTVSIKRVNKILQKLKEEKVESVSFSFFIGSLFPEAYENIKNSLLQERIKGYQEAKEEVINRLQGFIDLEE